jgi:hypothetical protein
MAKRGKEITAGVVSSTDEVCFQMKEVVVLTVSSGCSSRYLSGEFLSVESTSVAETALIHIRHYLSVDSVPRRLRKARRRPG